MFTASREGGRGDGYGDHNCKWIFMNSNEIDRKKFTMIFKGINIILVQKIHTELCNVQSGVVLLEHYIVLTYKYDRLKNDISVFLNSQQLKSVHD